MLIQLTSLHVAWTAFDVNPRWSNVVTMFLAQYPLAPTSMAKELMIHPRFLMMKMTLYRQIKYMTSETKNEHY